MLVCLIVKKEKFGNELKKGLEQLKCQFRLIQGFKQVFNKLLLNEIRNKNKSCTFNFLNNLRIVCIKIRQFSDHLLDLKVFLLKGSESQ